ncbi:MAG TPA: ABC transporter substrate-binding protein, partial [Thermoanaerobaculia bacterium]|nr:ABC transporter substrate-binding protein [Thermoanaerobaculia bacterium]
IGNSPFGMDVTAEEIQKTIDAMVRYGVGRMEKPPVAKDFVKTDLLALAKKNLGLK